MKLDAFVDLIKESAIYVGTTPVGGRVHDYYLLSENFLPVDQFSGYAGGCAFVSKGVPQQFFRGVVAHDVVCAWLKRLAVPQNRRHLMFREAFSVPNDEAHRRYSEYRLRMYNSLFAHFSAVDADPDILGTVRMSREMLQTHHEYSLLAA